MNQQEYEDGVLAIWKDFVVNATPLELHQSLISSNWDDNEFLLFVIKESSDTDKATALLAYWMAAPRWTKRYANRDEMLKRASYEQDAFDLVEELEKKYLDGFFKESKLAFDPKNDHDGYDWTSDYLDEKVVRQIPPEMFVSLKGEATSRNRSFTEGLPKEYWSRMEQLMDEFFGD